MKIAAALLVFVMALPAAAQDIRGLEACMAEKQIERRTGCLQANVELLQQTLLKQAHDTQTKLAAANADNRRLYEALEPVVGSHCPGLARTPYHIHRYGARLE